jgi:pimeloyl-ACP methyl ester carboxylesterase
MLILHGLVGAPRSPAWMDALTTRFEVLLPEHPGFGGTSPLDDIHDYAYFYLDMLDRLDLRRVHLVGLSLGGWIAAELAIRNTSRLASLTLVSALGLHVPGIEPIDYFWCSDTKRTHALFHDPTLAQRLPPTSEDSELHNRASIARIAWNPRFHNPSLQKWLHRIHIPTLLLWGAADCLSPPAHAHAYHRHIPHARLTILPACGHMPELETPSELVREITSFAGALELIS